MNPPNGLGTKIYLTLIKLYADQKNVRITGKLEGNGVSVNFDTDDPILSCEEIVKRYGKTKAEIEKDIE